MSLPGMSVSPQTELQMLPVGSRYSKRRWFFTIFSLLLYIVDIATDVKLAFKYVQAGHLCWAAMTLAFVLVGLLATQIFSYAWYVDDMNYEALKPGGTSAKSWLDSVALVFLHVFGMGIFTRYMQLLKTGYRELWPATSSYDVEEKKKAHHRLFCLATDLSMLKMFEAFLESLPQLLLQIYILLDHGECSFMQFVSMAFSLANAAWALVDYRRCHRRSLPSGPETPSYLPTAVYLLYKFCTITSCVLAYTLLLSLSGHGAAAALGVLWLLGTLWAFQQRTDFCSRHDTEWVYRVVVGAILTFSFFNIKGSGTRAPMSLYYVFHGALNAAAPLLFALLWSAAPAPPTGEATPLTVTPPMATAAAPPTATVALPMATELWFFWPVAGAIATGTVVGLVCLVVYYACMQPRGGMLRQEADVVDGLDRSAPSEEAGHRMRAFLQP